MNAGTWRVAPAVGLLVLGWAHAASGLDVHGVDARPDKVQLNDQMEDKNPEKTTPGAVAVHGPAVAGTKIVVTSMRFVPPAKGGRWHFAWFDRRKTDPKRTHVDFGPNPDQFVFGFKLRRPMDRDLSIVVKDAYTYCAKHAGSFPLKVEGNLVPPGVGVGPPPHWAAMVDLVEVVVTGPAETMEGTNSATFSVRVSPRSFPVESYEWTWKAPQGAGNNPEADFATPDQSSTIVKKARWFAFPDNRLFLVTGADCEYTINCNVTIAGSTVSDIMPPTWRVYLPTPSAETYPPRIDGFPAILARQLPPGQGIEWYVSGKGTLRRTPPRIVYYLPTTSQFFPKTKVHEERHVEQFTSIAPWKDLFDADALYQDLLSGMTDRSWHLLVLRVRLIIGLRNLLDYSRTAQNMDAAEKDAYTQSNNVAPDYLEVDYP